MTQTSCIPSSITLQRVVPETNTRRQYTVSVGRDLFGTPVVVCRWGRIGQAGRMRTHVCASIDAAEALAADVVSRRRRRGYNSGNDVAHQPSQVRARRPSVGQTRRRANPAQATAAAAQLPLFDAATLRASWLIDRRPGRTPSSAPLAVGKVSHIGTSSPSATPTSGPAPLVAPLMDLLGKPATAHERERMIEALINNPRMQGQLRRGRKFVRP